MSQSCNVQLFKISANTEKHPLKVHKTQGNDAFKILVFSAQQPQAKR